MWVGAGSIILTGVTIGNGAIVAAGSVVTKDVPDFAIVAGNPAKVVKFRFPETTRERILQIEWWNWSDEEIYAHSQLFRGPLSNRSLQSVTFTS